MGDKLGARSSVTTESGKAVKYVSKSLDPYTKIEGLNIFRCAFLSQM
jgi:hypothetical protein